MATLGKCITQYLMDGTASGRWQATLSNWNGVAYKIPHAMLKNCSDLPDLSTPGDYFLFGHDDGNSKPFVYIGEADDVLKRLMQPHTFEKDGSFWVEAVIFVTPDGSLEKGRVKYLENRLFTLATAAKRYVVKNGNTPKQSPMPKQIQDMLEEFIINVKLVLPAMGYDVLEPSPSSVDDSSNTVDDGILYFSRNHGKGGDAKGKLTADGFWVFKGSYINPDLADYVPTGIKDLRTKYASVIDSNGFLQEDVRFGSPSYASSFVCGKNSNGQVEWKNKDGISLKDIVGSSSSVSGSIVSDSQKSVNQSTESASGDDESAPADGEILYFSRNKGKGGYGQGKQTEDYFWVLKGSYIFPEVANYTPDSIKRMREYYSNLIDKNGILQKDIHFDSPSYASTFICGKNSNGLKEWKNKDGVTLKDLM
jgi:hypothetical protein